MLLSILIPIYNTEKYIKRCINSFINMSLYDYEVILVDDGSTDNSGKICDEYSKKHSQIKVIHQNNKGVVSARNIALNIASGEYITFIDSDDWVDTEFLPTLVSDLIKNIDCDIAIGNIKRNNEHFFSMQSQIMNRETAIKKMIHKQGCHWYLCGKVYRKKLFIDINIDENVTIFEDLDLNWHIFAKANNFIYNNKYAYHYFVNENGITEKRCDLNISNWRVFKRILFDKNVDFVRAEMTNFYVQIFLRHTLEMYFLDKIQYKKHIEEYINELNDTFNKIHLTQNIIPDNDFKIISDNYQSLVSFYDNIFNELENLIKILHKKNSCIYIYGTGIVAQYVFSVMKKMKIEPFAFVVSDGQAKKSKFMEKSVYYISELKINHNIAFVLALSGKAKEAVLKFLLEQNIEEKQIFPLNFPPIVW